MSCMLFLLCILLAAAVFFLLLKIVFIYQAADELRMQLAERMEIETNAGIDISASDKKFRKLAADLDRQLKLLRKKQIQYTLGDQELKAAVTNISHDLRTPLTAIYGYLNLLGQEEMSQAASEYLAVIENRVDAMKALAEELFRYSVILSVDSCTQKEEVCINAVLEESIAGYYGAIIEAGIRPDIRFTQHAVKRMLNGQALSRIFSNIISNALKYSDGDFHVKLDEDGTVHFSNRAAGLNPVRVGHLFDRFYTVETGRGSTGLGLSIARTLVQEMQGKIEAEYREESLYIHVYFPE